MRQRPRDLLREQIDLTGGRVKIPFQSDIEALLLGARSVIGEIEALLDQGVDIDRPVLSRPLTRMQQHVLDDRVGALAVLYDLVEIALQHIRNLADLRTQLAVEVRASERLSQFVNEFDRDGRKIVDEIKRVLIVVIASIIELLRIVGASTAPTSIALMCRWRSRPQHQEQTSSDGMRIG